MQSGLWGTNRPQTAKARPLPLVAKGLGGSSSSIAPRPIRKRPNPPKSDIFRNQPRQNIPPTSFRRFYDRGDLPVVVSFIGKRKIGWKVEVTMLDFHHYLPMFFEGLRELDEPYKFIADKALDDLLDKCPHKVLPVLPQLIIPIKLALNTKIPEVIVTTLKKLQKLVKCGSAVAEALVPYYRQILPIFNVFKNKRINLGDQIYYGQQRNENISDLIQETLELFETYGGEDAFINIKYMIPTYESCMF